MTRYVCVPWLAGGRWRRRAAGPVAAELRGHGSGTSSLPHAVTDYGRLWLQVGARWMPAPPL
jgi:hypothetical protein